MMWLYPVLILLGIASVVSGRAVWAAVLMADGAMIGWVGFSMIRNLGGAGDATLEYARQISLSGDRPPRPWLVKFMGTGTLIIGLGWFAAGLSVAVGAASPPS